MALFVNSPNVSSVSVQRRLVSSSTSLNLRYQGMSPRFQLNKSSSSSGLQVSSQLSSQISKLSEQTRSANDNIALTQTIQGALSDASKMLQRIRLLAAQAATSATSDEDRQALQEEVVELCRELSRIANKTTYAGSTMLNRVEPQIPPMTSMLQHNEETGNDELYFPVGEDTMTLALNGFTLSQIMSEVSGELKTQFAGEDQATYHDGLDYSDEEQLNAAGLIKDNDELLWDVSTRSSAQLTLDNIDSFVSYVDDSRQALDQIQSRIESAIRSEQGTPAGALGASNTQAAPNVSTTTSMVNGNSQPNKAQGQSSAQSGTRTQGVSSILQRNGHIDTTDEGVLLPNSGTLAALASQESVSAVTAAAEAALFFDDEGNINAAVEEKQQEQNILHTPRADSEERPLRESELQVLTATPQQQLQGLTTSSMASSSTLNPNSLDPTLALRTATQTEKDIVSFASQAVLAQANQRPTIAQTLLK